MRKALRFLMLAVAVVALAACGGGGGGSDKKDPPITGPILEGKFIDSPVEGLGYRTSSGLDGVTLVGGIYKYHDGDTVIFFIGSIELGEADAAPIMTPVSIVPQADGNSGHPRVVNIARLLQTLDNDGDPSNGILITESTTEVAETLSADAINLGDEAAFEETAGEKIGELTARNAVPVEANQLVSREKAQEHLDQSLEGMLAGERYKGDYAGGFYSDELGAIQFSIDETGTVSGKVESASDGEITLTGKIRANGTLEVQMNLNSGESYGFIEAEVTAGSGEFTGSAKLTGSESSVDLIGKAASQKWDSMKFDRDVWG